MFFGACIGGNLVYQGGLVIDPAILKSGLRSMSEPSSSAQEVSKPFALPEERQESVVTGSHREEAAFPIRPSRASPAG